MKHRSQTEVKKDYSHNLKKAYDALDAQEQILSQSEVAVLDCADEIYSKKGFEYFTPRAAQGALTGYSEYPDLEALDTIAKKLIEAGSTSWE